MEVQCPVPAQVPKLPLGYQVVEIADEQTLAPRAQPPGQGARRLENRSHPPRLPRSPVGYEVVQVAEEKAPGERPRHSPPARASRGMLRQQRPPLYWTVIALGGMTLTAL